MRTLSSAKIFFIALAMLWFAPLGQRELVRPDEGRYASIAREMATSGDYVTPTLNNLKYFEKPPLQYWATATAFNIFGETPFAARLWGALTGFLAILATFLTVRRLSAHAAEISSLPLISAAIHASMLWVYGMAHINALDAALAAFLHLCLCCYLLAYRPGIPAAQMRNFLIASAAFAALATLSKGLVGLVIPSAAIGLAILITRQWKLITQFPWLAAGALFFAITAPWFFWVSARNSEFAHFFFIHEHFERFTAHEHKREGAWWYFIPLLIAGTLPWLGFMVLKLRRRYDLKKARTYASTLPLQTFLLCWCAFIFVFFSISNSKLPSYILPMFGAIAILLAPSVRSASPRNFVLSLIPLALFGSGLIIASHPFFVAKMEDIPSRMPLAVEMAFWLRIAGIVFIAGFAYACWQRTPFTRARTVAVVALICVLSYGIAFEGHDKLSPMQSGAQLARDFRAKEGETAPQVSFYSVGRFDHTLPFYLRRSFILVAWRDEMDLGLKAAPERAIATVDDWIARWKTESRAYAIVENDQLKRLATTDFPYREVARDGRRAIISRQ